MGLKIGRSQELTKYTIKTNHICINPGNTALSRIFQLASPFLSVYSYNIEHGTNIPLNNMEEWYIYIEREKKQSGRLDGGGGIQIITNRSF